MKFVWVYCNYALTGVFGRPVTLGFDASQRPNFLRTSTRSKRFNTLRFFAVPLDLPKLGCLDISITFLLYLIFGINAREAKSPSIAFSIGL